MKEEEEKEEEKENMWLALSDWAERILRSAGTLSPNLISTMSPMTNWSATMFSCFSSRITRAYYAHIHTYTYHQSKLHIQAHIQTQPHMQIHNCINRSGNSIRKLRTLAAFARNRRREETSVEPPWGSHGYGVQGTLILRIWGGRVASLLPRRRIFQLTIYGQWCIHHSRIDYWSRNLDRNICSVGD